MVCSVRELASKFVQPDCACLDDLGDGRDDNSSEVHFQEVKAVKEGFARHAAVD